MGAHREYAPARLLVAQLRQAAGQHREAEASYREALDLDPWQMPAYWGLADLARLRGDHATSISLYTRLASLYPEAPGPRYALVQVYLAANIHGVTHARLTDIEHDRAAFTYELSGCRDEIEKNTGHRPRFAAYSFGAKSDAVLERTQMLGFDAAFGTHEGMVKKKSNLFALRRVQVDRTMPFLLFRLRTTGAVESYRLFKSIFIHG